MTTEFIHFSTYEISYRPTNTNLIFTNVLENPDCLQMEVDMLLEQYKEITIRKKGN